MSAVRTAGNGSVVANFARLDPLLLTAVIALLSIGIIMVASASITSAEREIGQPFYYLIRQIAYLGAGMVAATFCLLVPLHVWEKAGGVLLCAAFALLIAVLIPGIGREVNGAVRWLPLGPINVQASEPARLLILIFLSAYVARRGDMLADTLAGFLKPMAFVIAACVLLMLQPDFGATTVLLATAMAVLFAGGARLRYFASMLAFAVVSLAILAVASPYRMRRVTGFLDPWADPFDSGFQLTQSLIAIGRGEIFGVGLGGSVQKLFYLPEAHTDFVFAVYAEEFGFVGVVLLVALFAILVWRTLSISARAAAMGKPFAACLTFGLAVWLGAQAAVNIGVNMGLLPTKGLTLPLLSFGGSSLVVCCASVGLILRAHLETTPGENKRASRRGGRS
jgi:cell division protein FtsW